MFWRDAGRAALRRLSPASASTLDEFAPQRVVGNDGPNYPPALL